MKTKDCTYIVVKGMWWLDERLDVIGYPKIEEYRRQLINDIWTRNNKHIPQILADKIIGRC